MRSCGRWSEPSSRGPPPPDRRTCRNGFRRRGNVGEHRTNPARADGEHRRGDSRAARGGTPMTDTLERVQTYQQLIGGSLVDAASGQMMDVINPANDQVIASVPKSSQEDVDRAVNAAEAAFATWKTTTPQDRS